MNSFVRMRADLQIVNSCFTVEINNEDEECLLSFLPISGINTPFHIDIQFDGNLPDVIETTGKMLLFSPDAYSIFSQCRLPSDCYWVDVECRNRNAACGNLKTIYFSEKYKSHVVDLHESKVTWLVPQVPREIHEFAIKSSEIPDGVDLFTDRGFSDLFITEPLAIEWNQKGLVGAEFSRVRLV